MNPDTLTFAASVAVRVARVPLSVWLAIAFGLGIAFAFWMMAEREKRQEEAQAAVARGKDYLNTDKDGAA